MSARRLAVVGAGPVGVAAALLAARRGFEVVVLEAESVGASLLRWGPTRFFTPLGQNLPPGARELLGARLPDGDEAWLTGEEFATRVLRPLAQCAPLAGRVREGHRVVSIGRAGLLRGDHAGHPLRAEHPFRLLVEGPGGEAVLHVDAVLDASGNHGQPAWLGAGGMPAVGERAAGPRIVRYLGALHDARERLAGARVLLVGDGHSAANALGVLAQWAAHAPHLRVTWAVRTLHLRPVAAIAADPLPERQRIVSAANLLASKPPPWLRVERRAVVEALRDEGERLAVELTDGRRVVVDAVVSLTGYRPDTSLFAELAVELSPATEGSARLARALAGVTDCLCVPTVADADLASGEPGFHVLGAKSYGRASTFLLQTGYEHARRIIEAL